MKRDKTKKRHIKIMNNWRKQFERNVTEYKTPIDLKVKSGSIPKSIRGKYYKCGPGKFHEYGSSVLHPFDGDGVITAFHLGDGTAKYQSRIVDTIERQIEKKNNKRMFSGAFGTRTEMPKKIFELDMMKNTASTNVVSWGNKLIVLNESGIPYLCDPSSLQTLGALPPFRDGIPISTDIDWLDMVLSRMNIKICGDAVSAHPKIVKDRLVFYTLKYCIGYTWVTFYEMDRSLTIVSQIPYRVRGFLYIHDFVVDSSHSHYIFFQNNITIDPSKIRQGIIKCIQNDESLNGTVHAVSRTGSDSHSSSHEIQSGFTTHHQSIYGQEYPSYHAAFISVHYSKFLDFDRLAESCSSLLMTKWNMKANEFEQYVVFDSFLEFPLIYANSIIGVSDASSLYRIGFDGCILNTWDAGSDSIVGEPILVQYEEKIKNSRNFVLVVVFHSATLQEEEEEKEGEKEENDNSTLVILDADTLEKQAEIYLPESIPTTLHGTWVGE